LIDKGFSSRAATTFVTAITLTRRAKHWHDAIVAATGDRTGAHSRQARCPRHAIKRRVSSGPR
jgi:hypothetical protein